jgi:hypothetical protein
MREDATVKNNFQSQVNTLHNSAAYVVAFAVMAVLIGGACGPHVSAPPEPFYLLKDNGGISVDPLTCAVTAIPQAQLTTGLGALAAIRFGGSAVPPLLYFGDFGLGIGVLDTNQTSGLVSVMDGGFLPPASTKIIVSPDGDFAYFLNPQGSRIVKIDLSTQSVAATFTGISPDANDMVLVRSGISQGPFDELWISLFNAKAIEIVSASNGGVLGLITLAGNPISLAAVAVPEVVYVSTSTGAQVGAVYAVEVSTPRKVGTAIAVPVAGTLAINANGTRLSSLATFLTGANRYEIDPYAATPTAVAQTDTYDNATSLGYHSYDPGVADRPLVTSFAGITCPGAADGPATTAFGASAQNAMTPVVPITLAQTYTPASVTLNLGTLPVRGLKLQYDTGIGSQAFTVGSPFPTRIANVSSSHLLIAPSPQSVGGQTCTFQTWISGVGPPPASGTFYFTVPAASATITAVFSCI